METALDQDLGGLAINALNRHDLLHSPRNFLFEAQFRRLFLLDLDIPTGQFGGEASVLALLANCQRELVGIDNNFNRMTRLVDDKVPQLGWGQRVVDVLPNIRVPTDDVDLLTAEFAHDVFHAHSAHADAGADGIDLIVVRQDGNLSAITCLARDAFDLDGLVCD